jgi:Tfp pilus assembly protein PilF
VIAGLFINAFVFYLIYITSKSKQNRGISFGLLWFYIALIPSSSVIPFAEVLNDHRTFFPYIGLVISLVVLIRNLSLKYKAFENPVLKTVIILCGIVILFLHGIGTYQRNKVWETEEELWKEATIKSPLNGRAWMNYGIQLMAKADYVNADRCYDKALEILPDYSYIYINKGILNGIIGKKVDAEKYFEKALSINEGVPESYVYYAEFLIRENRFEEANIVIKAGLQISPKHEQLLILQSSIQYAINNANLNTSGKVKLALSNIAQNPTPENYIELSLAYYNEGLFEKCIEAANEALKLKPDYDLAYNNICAAYNELKEWAKAAEAGEKGLQINPQNKLIQGNLNVSKRNLK